MYVCVCVCVFVETWWHGDIENTLFNVMLVIWKKILLAWRSLYAELACSCDRWYVNSRRGWRGDQFSCGKSCGVFAVISMWVGLCCRRYRTIFFIWEIMAFATGASRYNVQMIDAMDIVQWKRNKSSSDFELQWKKLDEILWSILSLVLWYTHTYTQHRRGVDTISRTTEWVRNVYFRIRVVYIYIHVYLKQ